MSDSGTFKLTIRQGPRPNQLVELDKDVYTIGREVGNDLVIEDPQVSRRHARLTRQGHSYLLEDLGSTNGTFVNGSRVTTPVLLANGDLIGLADTIVIAAQTPLSGEATLVSPAADEFIPGPPPTQPAFTPPKVVAPPKVAPSKPAPVPAPPPVYTPPEVTTEPAPTTDNRRIILIGCGCLALLAVVAVIGLVAWSFIDCGSFSGVFKFLFPPFAC